MLSALNQADLIVQIHAYSAVAALILGPVNLYRTKRDRVHKVAGYVWVVLMALVALSALGITAQVGPTLFGFGVIHGLVGVVFVSLFTAIRAARAGDIARHRSGMTQLYWQAMVITGLITLVPGRIMNEVLFGSRPDLAWCVIGAVLLAMAAVWWMRRHRSPIGFEA